jgi:hypothetical protein
MAIRRGPLAAPDDATKVFTPYAAGQGAEYPALVAGFTVDMALRLYKDGGIAPIISARLQGSKYLETSNNSAEQTTSSIEWDYNTGWWDQLGNSSFVSHMWKRAPSYFDVCAFSGNSTAGRTVPHGLTVAPEMIWLKRRDYTKFWYVYHKDLDASNPSHKYLVLNETDAVADSTSFWNDTEPTSSVFTVGDSSGVNSSGATYISYLFATLAGVSKCGSYSGNGGTQNIDCGFSNGARFVLIKRTDNNSDWFVFDSVRGINSGTEPRLELNNTDDEPTATDQIDPYSGGFNLASQSSFNINISGASYIFYAIA